METIKCSAEEPAHRSWQPISQKITNLTMTKEIFLHSVQRWVFLGMCSSTFLLQNKIFREFINDIKNMKLLALITPYIYYSDSRFSTLKMQTEVANWLKS